MGAMKRYSGRGFTLVELMIVVAIIGVLAALAIYGVRRYMASAKTSEAKNSVGAITRGAASAFEREIGTAQILAVGGISTGTSHDLCLSADPVPATVPAGTKYQPAEADWGGVDDQTGWRCLKVAIIQPIYYQYHYRRDANVVAGAPPIAAPGFEAAAIGDLDADTVQSAFARGGTVVGGQLTIATQIYIENEYE